MMGSTLRCPKCNQYAPDRCTCAAPDTPVAPQQAANKDNEYNGLGINCTAQQAAPLPAAPAPTEQDEGSMFEAWWDANQVDPAHTLTVQNAARAAWYARAARQAPAPAPTEQAADSDNIMDAAMYQMLTFNAKQAGFESAIDAVLTACLRDAPKPKLTLALPDHETRRIVIASDEVIDGERIVCVAIEAPTKQAGELSQQQILTLVRPYLDEADGGYICDTGPEHVVAAFGAVLAARQAPTEAPKERNLRDYIRPDLSAADFGLSGDEAVKAEHYVNAVIARQAPDSQDAWRWPEFKDWIDSNRERPLSPYGWAEMAFNAGRAQEKAQ